MKRRNPGKEEMIFTCNDLYHKLSFRERRFLQDIADKKLTTNQFEWLTNIYWRVRTSSQ